MEQLSKARIKLIHSLQHKKYRLKYDKFIVEGLKITKELIAEHQNMVESIYISNPDYQSILTDSAISDRVCQVSPQEMRSISEMVTPPGVLAVCQLPAARAMPNDISGKRMFYLEGIRDPGNMGTILRLADWFGMEHVLISPDCVDVYNQKVIQASMSSFLRVQTHEVEVHTLPTLNSPVYVCDMDGVAIHTFAPPLEGIFVLGNESQGVSEELKTRADKVISISGEKSLGAESLNVASVAAIIGAWLQSS